MPSAGTFTVPVLDNEPHTDPSTRPYMIPPKPKETVKLHFPLVDFREKVLSRDAIPDYDKAQTFMTNHGFTAVHHTSKLQNRDDFEDPDSLKDVYYPEVEELVKRVTGCTNVCITNSTCRGGIPPPDFLESVTWKGHKDVEDSPKDNLMAQKGWHKPTPGQPIRIPHCDSTALGGRGSVRHWMKEMTNLASKHGILEHEDSICQQAGVKADEEASCKFIEDAYNDGKLGPRYAVFSIWRPLRPVTRDPLAMTPWSAVSKHSDFVIEPYMNRMQGVKGDWKKNLAMLKVKPSAAALERPKFYFVDHMQTNEVLFVKMFDTAGFGEDATQELGCLHGSPDLGDAGYGDPRESIEVRCMAFW